MLRSSSVIGNMPPYGPILRALFLQFVESVLDIGKPVVFFNNEHRNAVFVRDIVRMVECVCRLGVQEQLMVQGQGTGMADVVRVIGRVFNMGGPERLSRLDMAHKVC